MSKPLVIANGLLPDHVRQRILPRLTQALRTGVDWQFTTGPRDATRQTREALHSGAEWIIAAGGDGTINEVVNGFFEDGRNMRRDCPLSFLPLGSGNDLLRTLGVPLDPIRAAESLATARDWLVDVGHARYVNLRGEREERVFVNFAEAGVGARLVQRMNRRGTRRNRAAYLLSAITTAMRYRPRPVDLRFDTTVCRGPLLSFIVANGRFFGAGMECAPMARPDDGTLDTITIGDFGRLELVLKIRKLVRGEHLAESKVRHYPVRSIESSSPDRIWVQLDGDTVGTLPATFSILPQAVLLRC